MFTNFMKFCINIDMGIASWTIKFLVNYLNIWTCANIYGYLLLVLRFKKNPILMCSRKKRRERISGHFVSVKQWNLLHTDSISQLVHFSQNIGGRIPIFDRGVWLWVAKKEVIAAFSIGASINYVDWNLRIFEPPLPLLTCGLLYKLMLWYLWHLGDTHCHRSLWMPHMSN